MFEFREYKNHNDDPMYLLSDLEAYFPIKHKFHEHDYGDILFIKTGSPENEDYIEFGLCSFTEGDEPKYYSKVFNGYGFGGLREMRHIWWGDSDGYNFYLPIDSTIKALTILKQYFD